MDGFRGGPRGPAEAPFLVRNVAIVFRVNVHELLPWSALSPQFFWPPFSYFSGSAPKNINRKFQTVYWGTV